MTQTTTDGGPTFEARDAKALTEVMTILGASLERDLRDDEYRVYTTDETYRVDMIAETCTCSDMLFRRPDGGCKHIRRVAFARGERPIPAWVDHDAIDDRLGQHIDGTPDYQDSDR